MTRPLPIALFGNDEDGFDVVWNRNPRRRNTDDGFGGETAEGGDDAGSPFDFNGLGQAGEQETEAKPSRQRRSRKSDSFEGNATESGQLVGDDQVPF